MSNLVSFACDGSIALEIKGSDPHRRTKIGQAILKSMPTGRGREKSLRRKRGGLDWLLQEVAYSAYTLSLTRLTWSNTL